MQIQMILVLLALALFSTLLLNTYNIMLDQSAIVYNNIRYLQGQKIADRYFQKIEAELFGYPPVRYFSQVHTFYSNLTETINVNGLTYNIDVNSTYCDSLGENPGADTLYQKIDLQINCTSTTMDTLFIGTANSPISKVYVNRRF